MKTTDIRPKVYGASHTGFAGGWKNLRHMTPEVIWTARWPDLVLAGNTELDGPVMPQEFWTMDLEDIEKAQFVLVMGDPLIEASVGIPNKPLRGALVEAGMGIALGKSVITVGRRQDYGTWQYHPRVYRAPHLDDAISFIKEVAGQ